MEIQTQDGVSYMVDTDKYEGHTSDWKWIDINEQDDFYLHSEYGDIINHDTPDGKLAQDAPLLLAEVKRLRKQLQLLHDTWFTDAEMASDVDERMTTLLKGMIE